MWAIEDRWTTATDTSLAAITKEDGVDRQQLQALVQASIRNRLITKPFDLLFEMQHAALEIADHRIIG
jgi:hypothetical protein